MAISKNTAGLILGSFLGTLHLLWSILVAAGLAQPLMDFIFNLHFMKNPYMIMPFNIVTALELVVVTAVIGYVAGWFLAFISHKIQSK